MVRYQYNSWGKVTSTQDTSGVSLATLNPFRYRKYLYDPETGIFWGNIVKSLDRSKGYTRSSLRAGIYIHNWYKATSEFIKKEKEVRLISKSRPDYVDKTRKIIYELKPMNKRNVKKGMKQLMRYREELGDEFEMILELY